MEPIGEESVTSGHRGVDSRGGSGGTGGSGGSTGHTTCRSGSGGSGAKKGGADDSATRKTIVGKEEDTKRRSFTDLSVTSAAVEGRFVFLRRRSFTGESSSFWLRSLLCGCLGLRVREKSQLWRTFFSKNNSFL
ncbi:hypothetical protein Bca101_025877 [Brassica carinata]